MPARSNAEFLDIIHRALAGDNDAAKIILDEYREPLLCVIRRKINPKLRRILDSTDFLQDTFLEAFAGKLADKEFQSPQAFLVYLKKIAEHRVQNTARQQLLAKRSPFGHEVPLDVLSSGDKSEPEAATPIDDTERAELRRRVGKLPLVYRAVMEMWLNGAKPAEIAERLRLDVKSVYRCLESAHRKLRAPNPPPPHSVAKLPGFPTINSMIVRPRLDRSRSFPRVTNT